MSWNDYVVFPGVVLELFGVLVLVMGAVSGEPLLIISGVVIICIAPSLHLARIIRQREAGSGSPDQGISAPAFYAPENAVSQRTPGNSRILYEDNLVHISEGSITFLHYTFPFFSSGRQVSFSKIDHIDVKKPTILNGKWRIGGSGDLGIWFPLDWNRPSRDRIFYATLKTRGMKIGFTVEHSAEVVGILRKKGVTVNEEGI